MDSLLLSCIGISILALAIAIASMFNTWMIIKLYGRVYGR